MSKTKTKIVSHSQYYLWHDCPLKWKGLYIDKVVPREATIHTVYGLAMHTTVQDWLDIVFNGSTLIARTISLRDTFKDNLFKEFEKTVTNDNGVKTFVCDKPTLIDFYKGGCEALEWLQENLEKFYSTLEWKLIDIELPLRINVRLNIDYRGYLDIVLQHKITNAIKIIDLKATKNGWGKWQKKNKAKVDQLLIYKRYYSEQYNVPENDISVEFHILRREIWEGCDWPIPRVSRFIPSQKKPSMNKTMARFESFLDGAFDEEGNYRIDNLPATPSKDSCIFCPFNKENDPSQSYCKQAWSE